MIPGDNKNVKKVDYNQKKHQPTLKGVLTASAHEKKNV